VGPAEYDPVVAWFQARALLTFLEGASERSLASTLAISGPPGRGKTAALGGCGGGMMAKLSNVAGGNIRVWGAWSSAASDLWQVEPHLTYPLCTGLCLAGAIACGYSNVLLTAKDPASVQGVSLSPIGRTCIGDCGLSTNST
jgi:hypothetical protein